MKRLIYTILVACIPTLTIAQISQPDVQTTGEQPDFSIQYRAPGDSCGAYFNNYIGLGKTTIANVEELRQGNLTEAVDYGGMAQRFHANQPIEVSGVEFYAYHNNVGLDSVMVITRLNDYTPGNDSVGVEFARDTVYVTHTAFDIVLPNISVQSYFDTPVTVTQDYVMTVEIATDDTLILVVSNPGTDGNGEGLGFYYYNNPFHPSFIGYYNQFSLWGAAWDFDALISPLVKYDLHDDFMITDDSICPNVVSAGCVSYSQVPNYTDLHYNAFSTTSTDHILWLWGDGFQNTNLTSACHTYSNSGDYNIDLRDTLRRWDFQNPFCVAEITNPIHVINDVVASATFSQGGTIVNFTNTSSYADSVWWDFDDTTAGTNQFNPTHDFGVLDTFNVMLIAYNECSSDTTYIQIITDDVGIEDYGIDFLMYPNPANNEVNLSGMITGAQIELLNVLGQTIAVGKSNNGIYTFETSPYTNGTYFVRVTTDTGQVTKKLMIQH